MRDNTCTLLNKLGDYGLIEKTTIPYTSPTSDTTFNTKYGCAFLSMLPA